MKQQLDQLDFSGNSLATQRAREQLIRLAKFSWPLVIEGERGTGKRRAAQILYETCPLAGRGYYPIDSTDCNATFPSVELLEERGGVVVLENISQSNFLFQDRCWKWLRTLPRPASKFRIVSTAEQPLGTLVAARKFRADLYLELRVTNFEIPPLRLRGDDLPFLVRDFLEEARAHADDGEKMFTAEAIDWMLKFTWPGNVTQLRDEILRAYSVTPGKILARSTLTPDYSVDPEIPNGFLVRESLRLTERLRDFEKEQILSTLRDVGGYRDRAAQVLGIDRRTLQRKLRRWKVGREIPEPKPTETISTATS